MSIEAFSEHEPRLHTRAWVHPSACVIGRVELDEDVSIWPCAVLRGDVQAIRIGARSNVQDGCVVHVTHASNDRPDGLPTIIGADVTIGHGAIIHACRIDDRVLVGMNATVLDGAHIASDVLVAAGSLVAPNKELASGFLYAGQPARPIRPLRPEEIEFLTHSAAQYVQLMHQYRGHTS